MDEPVEVQVEGPPTEHTYAAIEECDVVMAAYTDARKRMNDLRLARGFYPVVATVQQPTPPPQAVRGRRDDDGQARLDDRWG